MTEKTIPQNVVPAYAYTRLGEAGCKGLKGICYFKGLERT